MTKIEWTHRPGTKGETWNPIVGCSIVSPGCTNCYAMKMAARILNINAGKALDEARRVRSGFIDYGTPEQREQELSALRSNSSHYDGTIEYVKGKPVWTGKVALAPDRILTAPIRASKPRTYFVNSMGDVFHEDVPDDWIDRVFAVMALCRQHTFLVLTKRSARMKDYLSSIWTVAPAPGFPRGDGDKVLERVAAVAGRMVEDGDNAVDVIRTGAWPLPNVWLGVSAERQQEADERVPDLLATPAAVRFVSAEPLLGPVDFTSVKIACAIGGTMQLNALTGIVRDLAGFVPNQRETANRIDWVIVGGESGKGARPMHPNWARAIRDQCQAAGVPFFFKQWGAWLPSNDDVNFEDGELWARRHFQGRPFEQHSSGHTFVNVGKSRAGRLLDGREHSEWPETI